VKNMKEELQLTIYIDTQNGNDENNGSSFENAIKTEKRAMEIISRRITSRIITKGKIELKAETIYTWGDKCSISLSEGLSTMCRCGGNIFRKALENNSIVKCNDCKTIYDMEYPYVDLID